MQKNDSEATSYISSFKNSSFQHLIYNDFSQLIVWTAQILFIAFLYFSSIFLTFSNFYIFYIFIRLPDFLKLLKIAFRSPLKIG